MEWPWYPSYPFILGTAAHRFLIFTRTLRCTFTPSLLTPSALTQALNKTKGVGFCNAVGIICTFRVIYFYWWKQMEPLIPG